MHWLSKGRSGCLHVPWCSEGLLVMCFAVGGGWFFLGWILNCRVTWKCIYTCLLLSTCAVFVLGLVLLQSMSLSPPLLPIYSQVASPFHLRLLAVALGLFGWYLQSCWQMGWYLIGNGVTLEFDLSPLLLSLPNITIIVSAIIATYFKLDEFFWSTALYSGSDLIFYVKCKIFFELL